MSGDAEEQTITTTGTDVEGTLLPVDTAERRFGRYELGYEIASGGMATIFLARARGPGGFDRPFAIKRIHPHLAKQRDFVDMFLDEARLQSKISHPNVCSVVDFGEIDGTYYMAMEYLLGRPLTAVSKAVSGRPELQRSLRWQALAARIVADACEGLHAAHELKDESGRPLSVVHRDVTPHNLILTYEGAVKVVDFGVAFAEGRTHETKTGAVKGKFAYMSPEQVRGRDLDRRVDVWALGVCLWELLAGQRLYGKRSDVELIHAIVNEPLRPPSSAVPLPAALDAIVMRALERDLERRTPSARTLGRELSTFVAATGVPAGIVELAELMQELDGTERTKRLDVVASLMSAPVGPESEPTQSGARMVRTLTVDRPEGERLAPPPPAAQASAAPVEPALEVRVTRRHLAIGAAALGTVALVALVATLAAGPTDGESMRAVELPRASVVSGAATREPPRLASDPPLPPAPATPPAVVPLAPLAPPVVLPAPTAAVTEATSEPPTEDEDEEADEGTTARAAPARGPGTLNVATPGGWAELLVDGEVRGTSPQRMTLPAGRHVIELRRDGRSLARRTVTVRPGATTRLSIPVE